MRPHKLSPLRLLVAATLLALPLVRGPVAHAKPLGPTTPVPCNLILSSLGATTNGTAVAPKGSIKQGSSIIINCTVGANGTKASGPCSVAFTCGDQTQSVGGVQLAAYATKSLSSPAFTVTQAVGTTITLSAEVNPYSSAYPGGYAVSESSHSDNKLSMTVTVVQ